MKNTVLIIIDGKRHSKEDILNIFSGKSCVTNIPLWKKEIYEFLSEWFNEEDYVMAQTSGSTGKPKHIKLKKQKMLASAHKTCNYFSLTEKDNLLLCLPVKYIAGKMMIVRAIERNMNIITIEPKGKLDVMGLDKIDFAAMVPLQVKNLLKLDYTFHNTRYLLVGGAVVPLSVKEKLQNCQCQVYETYGMTETYTHIALKKINGQNRSEYFNTLNGIQVFADDKNCLQINAKHISNDIIKTNDIVDLIDSKRFIWKGRYDNIINSGGVKIIPEVVEKKLKKIIEVPFIISSEADEKLGEKVVLIIESEPFTKQKRKELEQFFIRLLEKYERPKNMRFSQKLERTKAGKLKRK